MARTPAAQAALAWLCDHAPTPQTPHEAVALAIHALLLHHDFRPAPTTATTATVAASTIATAAQAEHVAATTAHAPVPEADTPAEAPPSTTGAAAAAATPTTTTTTTTTTDTPPLSEAALLPQGWVGPAAFGGIYLHARSAMQFDIRAVRMGRRLVLHAAARDDDDSLHTVDVRVDDYVADEGGEGGGRAGNTDYWQALTPRLDALATLVAVQLAYRLVPGAAKDGYEHADAGSGSAAAAPTERHEEPPPPRPFPMQPYPRPHPNPHPHPFAPPHPDHDPDPDPLRIGRPRRPAPPALPPRFGDDDLIAPGLPRLPGAAPPFDPRGGGNLVGPEAFAGPRRPLPPGVPPGARFDPFAPPPDPDAEPMPGWEDEHRIAPSPRQPPQGPAGGMPRRPPGAPPGGYGDMFF